MMMMVMAEDLVQLLLNLLHHVMCELRLMKAMTRRIIIVMIKQSLMEFMCKFKLISFILMISRMMTKCMMIIMLITLISTSPVTGFGVGTVSLCEVTRLVPTPPQNNDHQQILLSLYVPL